MRVYIPHMTTTAYYYCPFLLNPFHVIILRVHGVWFVCVRMRADKLFAFQKLLVHDTKFCTPKAETEIFAEDSGHFCPVWAHNTNRFPLRANQLFSSSLHHQAAPATVSYRLPWAHLGAQAVHLGKRLEPLCQTFLRYIFHKYLFTLFCLNLRRFHIAGNN